MTKARARKTPQRAEFDRVMGGIAPAARRRRELRAVESWASARDAIGTLEHGGGVFMLTRGQWSMLDLVRAVLEQTGPADVSVWTWVIAEYEVEAMTGLLSTEGIRSARLVVDYACELRPDRANVLDGWRAKWGPESVRVCMNHAKIARVYNDQWRVLLRGSMNLNFNPRLEQADLTEGGPDFDLVAATEAALPVLPVRVERQAYADASGVSRAWEARTLGLFEGIKTWRK